MHLIALMVAAVVVANLILLAVLLRHLPRAVRERPADGRMGSEAGVRPAAAHAVRGAPAEPVAGGS